MKDDTARIAEIAESIEHDQPSFDQLQDSQKVSADMLARAEQELQEWQTRFDSYNKRLSEANEIAQVERSRIEQLERGIGEADTRLARLDEERGSLEVEPLSLIIQEAITEEVAAAAEEQRLQQSLAQANEKQQVQRELIRKMTDQLNELKSQIQSGLGRLASLEALQQAALEPDSSAADTWLHMNELDELPRLAQSITAAPGWEKAVELVLGSHLEAVCVDGDSVIERCLKDLPAAQLTLMQSSTDAGSSPSDTLASKVEGNVDLGDVLKGVFVADSIGDALARRKQLGQGESVVTQDGLWMGRTWLRIARADSQDSVLLRETEIAELKAELSSREVEATELESQVSELIQQQDEHETKRETLLHSFNDAVRHLSSIKSALSTDRQRLEQNTSRRQALTSEIDELSSLHERDVQDIKNASTRRSEAMEKLEALQSEGDALGTEQDTLKENVRTAREQSDADRDAGQALAIRVESLRSTREATEKNLSRIQARISQLVERQTALNAMLASEDEDPLLALEAGLQEQLAAKLTSDNSMRVAREELDAIEHRLREHEQARHRHDSRAQKAREDVQNERMSSQEVVVRLKTLDEQLAEHEYNVSEIAESLPQEATLDVWTADLEKLESRIQRLGPINLAAIDELAEQLQRKEYLDEQHHDVTEALETLERAIAKIDRETRSRFKDTFEKVNSKFEEFFPRLFGGGHASLQMTGDDLLSTGVSVVAQPPGKRVSNIQLLSGGEKALTAVALVFAFFELNPSPFCMLDEVDAPLDDANVGRFCTLVKEMSERVQFIFITHNKVTMEMAQQLMGVTMNEPGVSRLVAVDVHEAVELAGA